MNRDGRKYKSDKDTRNCHILSLLKEKKCMQHYTKQGRLGSEIK